MSSKGDGLRGGPRLYTVGVSSVYGGFRRTRLDGEGGASRRRHAPILGSGWVASVAGRFGRYWVGFRDQTGKTVLGEASAVHQRAGQGWHRVDITVSCRRA
jgi:hypothetical protein